MGGALVFASDIDPEKDRADSPRPFAARDGDQLFTLLYPCALEDLGLTGGRVSARPLGGGRHLPKPNKALRYALSEDEPRVWVVAAENSLPEPLAGIRLDEVDPCPAYEEVYTTTIAGPSSGALAIGAPLGPGSALVGAPKEQLFRATSDGIVPVTTTIAPSLAAHTTDEGEVWLIGDDGCLRSVEVVDRRLVVREALLSCADIPPGTDLAALSGSPYSFEREFFLATTKPSFERYFLGLWAPVAPTLPPRGELRSIATTWVAPHEAFAAFPAGAEPQLYVYRSGEMRVVPIPGNEDVRTLAKVPRLVGVVAGTEGGRLIVLRGGEVSDLARISSTGIYALAPSDRGFFVGEGGGEVMLYLSEEQTYCPVARVGGVPWTLAPLRDAVVIIWKDVLAGDGRSQQKTALKLTYLRLTNATCGPT